ncbi:hypothetical protein V1287_003127 [Bradyrhizobium sp. AZCC 1699]
MATVVFCPEQEACTLEDCVRELHATLDVHSEDSFLRAAGVLRKLANNREFLAKPLIDHLREIAEGRTRKRPSRILPLYECSDFTVRALFWEPVPVGVEGSQFFYNIPHDHNFDFLTVNYCGPPLESEVYQYDNQNIRGTPGEMVAIRRQGRIALENGTVVFFRAGHDIHSQLPPDQFCVTLNVLGPHKVDKSPWWFDTERGRIVDWVDHTANAKALLNRAHNIAVTHLRT